MRQAREALRAALWDLALNPVRSLLSLLGVMIGITSITTILALGAGVHEQIFESVAALGASAYRVYPSYDAKSNRMGELRLEDVETIASLPFVKAAIPEAQLFNKIIRAPQRQVSANVRGAGPELFQGEGHSFVAGRAFDRADEESRAQVCAISQPLAEKLFGHARPEGQTLWVEGVPWEILGVFAKRKASLSGFLDRGDELVIVPFRTLIRVSKEVRLTGITAHVAADHKGPVIKDLQEALERDDPRRKGLYRVHDTQAMREMTAKISTTLTLVGALIGAISLVVGGIGLMNVMLTSVAERTREIGLRRALGARKADVLWQFLVESSLLSLIAGILGLVAGIALALLLSKVLLSVFQQEIRARFLPSFILLAVGISTTLGVLFGLYPASKAARLSPAEALRAE